MKSPIFLGMRESWRHQHSLITVVAAGARAPHHVQLSRERTALLPTFYVSGAASHHPTWIRQVEREAKGQIRHGARGGEGAQLRVGVWNNLPLPWFSAHPIPAFSGKRIQPTQRAEAAQGQLEGSHPSRRVC